MTTKKSSDVKVIPIPASETQAEHDRIRKSNDRDQQAEREGRVSKHNKGYDEAADGKVRPPKLEGILDE